MTLHTYLMPKAAFLDDRPAWAQALVRRRLIDLKGKSQTAVALDSIILQQRTVSEVETAKYPPDALTAERLAALARGYEWSLDQMELATGLKFNLGPQPPLMLEPGAKELTDFVIRPIEPLAAAAGTPEVAEHNSNDVYIMPRADYRSSYRFFTADGDSMSSSDGDGIQHGDTLIVDTSITDPRADEIFVVQDQTGAVVVKRIRVWNGAWWLTSDNPRYPPFQLDEALILGIVKDAEGKRNIRKVQ